MTSKSVLKKTIILMLSMIMMLSFAAFSGTLVHAENDAPTRIINVVYDDSVSMIYNSDTKTNMDTWCQAKYSMEVFAAMLEQKDTMNIYVMSDYYNKVTNSPRLTLLGADGAKANVEKVHNLLTDASETPFDAVRKAYSDLEASNADEKWLVILTDGAFANMENSEVDRYFSSKSADISIMFLGMGASAAAITEKPSQDIYFEKAETSDQILNKITDICTRIFNSDKLEDVRENQMTFDIPMSELTVFAQGASVQIRDIVGPDGESIGSSVPVEVKYSEVATSRQGDRFDNPKVDTELAGSIITFQGDFNPGTYILNIQGAETLEVYYKPNVELMAFLVDEEGNEVAYTEGIKAGKYRLDFGFVKAGTSEKIGQSSLLGDVSYHARLSYNGAEEERDYSAGEMIEVQEGKYGINVTADYLKYNTAFASLEFEVFRDKQLNLEIEDSPAYEIVHEGFANADEPIRVRANLEGTPFTAEQWKELEVPDLVLTSNQDAGIEFAIEKTDEIGIYHIYPKFTDKLEHKEYPDDYKIELSLKQRNGNELWLGEAEETVHISDSRSWFDKNRDLVVRAIIGSGILAFFLGYVPGIKKYLPKKLKSKPRVEGKPKARGVRPIEGWGKLTKNRLTTCLPYVREKGTIRCLPKGRSGATLKVRAAGGGKMDLMNVKEFAGKDKVLFNGIMIPKDTKKKQITAGTEVKAVFTEMTYSCILNK